MENETNTNAPRTDERDILSTTMNSTNKKRTWVEEGRRWKTTLILKHPILRPKKNSRRHTT